jgi:hypothetical protein
VFAANNLAYNIFIGLIIWEYSQDGVWGHKGHSAGLRAVTTACCLTVFVMACSLLYMSLLLGDPFTALRTHSQDNLTVTHSTTTEDIVVRAMYTQKISVCNYIAIILASLLCE